MNKNFLKKLALLMALLTAFSSFALAGCGKASEEDNTTTTSAVSSEDEADVTTAATEAKPQVAVLKKSYKPAEAFDLEGNSVALETIFGTGYAKHGDELIFNEDGTFTMYIGVYANPDSVKGTYKVNSTTEVVLTFDNDTQKSAVITVTDLESNAIELRIPMNEDYNVMFR